MTDVEQVPSTELAEQVAGISRRRLLCAMPAAGFGSLALVLGWAMTRDSSEIPSALIGKSVPEFNLPPIQGHRSGLASSDLYGQVSLVNVFASWCVACQAEHPILMRLAADQSVPLHGLNYKDEPADAVHWLNERGDPYARTGADRNGRVAIDWGVYGVPETFVVTAEGRIAHKHIGPLTEFDLSRIILPLVDSLRRGGGRS